MAGVRGRFGPPGNQNAFRHGLAGIAQRRADGVLNPAEQSLRKEILSGLLSDKGGAPWISTASALSHKYRVREKMRRRSEKSKQLGFTGPSSRGMICYA